VVIHCYGSHFKIALQRQISILFWYS